MKVPLNDLGRGPGTSAEVAAAVARVLQSGWYVHGPEHAAFEGELAAFVGARHAVGVASGTDALELALRAVRPDDPGAVLTAANAGGYTTVAARRAGRQVRYADVDASTMCLDPRDVERRLDGVAAVVVTHLYGRLAPVEDLVAVCARAGVALVEDCAQAAGARRGGRRAGSSGDAATFSFYPTKNLAAVGDGGAVVTSSDEVADRLRQLRQYGWGAKYGIEVDGGRNSRLDELQAAVLRVGLGRLDEDNARRREVIARYAEAAAGSSVQVLPARGEDHVAHLAVAVTHDRDRVRQQLAAAGVGTDVHYPVPDHRQAAYGAHHADLTLPATEDAARRVFSLPCFPQLTEPELDTVCAALRTA